MTENSKQKSKKTIWIIGCVALAVGCIPCTGITAAVAIPSFINYVKRSKTSEARANLASIYAGLEGYYAANGSLPPSAPPTRAVPGPEMVIFPVGSHPTWTALGFEPRDPQYYSYELETHPDGTFVIRARGDLDGDGVLSVFELAGRPGPAGLERAPGIYTMNELE